MSRSEIGSMGSITADQLVALNDEMAALVRMGVPLEDGLTELGHDMPGQLGKLATYLGQQMQTGRNLAEILASDEKRFPPVWRAVVEAGMRSGRLSAALEGMARTGRSVAQLRRSTIIALIYPVIVLTLAYAAILVVLTVFIPTLQSSSSSLLSTSDPLLDQLATAGQSAEWWFFIPPLAFLILLGIWWYRSRRALWASGTAASGRDGCQSTTRRVWSIRQSKRNGRSAMFAELLALLIDQGVPMQEAVVLAGEASGDRILAQQSRKIAQRLERGEVLHSDDELLERLPPLLAWSIGSGMHNPSLSRTLNSWAAAYRVQAIRDNERISTYLPMILSAVIGGLAVLLLALLVFGPLIRLLYQLGLPQ